MISSYVKTQDFHIEKNTITAPMTDMHFHNAHEMYFLIKGSREYFIEDRFFDLHDGDAVFVPHDVLHRTAGKGALRILVFFSEEFLTRFFSREVVSRLTPVLQTPVHRLPPDDCEWLSGALHHLLHEYEQQKAGVRPRDETLLAVWLFQLLWRLGECRNTFSPVRNTDSRISDIVKYINENFSTVASIEEIADRFYFSKYYLCQLFRKNVGITLFTYLNTVKIQYACTLIQEGRENMTEISLRCGFNTPSYFSKVFRSIMGVSPSEYRHRTESAEA